MWEYLVKRIRPRGVEKPENADVHRAHNVDPDHADRPIDLHENRPQFEGQPPKGEPTVPARRPRRLVCPACQSPMQRELIGNVEIDRCEQCGGIFLDRGELEALSGRPDPSSYVQEPRGEDPALIYTPHGLTSHVREDFKA
ncbi:MAG: zf-TFIIB domain-containing protein [Spirochaetales bacterium]|nr:zf-TFIIB domain-containing protein [Leptospiraceae bacterium]MCP5482844.1 zf-TFIIB domain-containing protein [Spirochaetales bacterium]